VVNKLALAVGAMLEARTPNTSELANVEAFIEKLGVAGIPIVRYNLQELDSELAVRSDIL
jgi:D-mannonate dehydratase